MIRFLLLLLLLPGAELVANNTDAVESFASTTLGAQFIMTVTPKTTLRKPLPASHETANKTAVPHPPPPKDGKKQPSLLNPAKVQLVQGGANTSDTISPYYQQRSSMPYESQINSTKIPLTARSHSFSEPPQKRPVVRKVPIVPNKAKTVPKFTTKNPSARYQSLPHLHHKNVTSKPVTGQSRDSNFTAGSRGLPFSPINQRTANTPLKNTFKPGQIGVPFPPERVKQFPGAVQAVTQMSRQLKEKSSNTSVLLNTLVNQNSSLLTNSLQHMAQSSNSTFTTGREAVLHELNSLNTQNHLLNTENVTSVPEADRHNDVSGDGLLRKVNLPGAHDSKVLQELRSKVNVRIPDRNMFTHTNLSSTELTTQPSVISLTQIDILATQTARTSDIVSHSNNHSEGLVEAATEVQSGIMTGVATKAKSEKDQTRLGMTEGHRIHHNLTHSHKHRHQVLESLNHAETNTISQPSDRPYDRTASLEPNRHHQKHLHNHTQPHSHNHHKHRSDHHLQRNHVSQTLVHLNAQEQPNSTTQIQPSQSNPQQLHTELKTSAQRDIFIQNNTHFSAKPSNPFSIGAPRENDIGSVTAGLSGISGTAHPRLTTQTAFDTHSETMTQEPTTQHTMSVTDRHNAVHKLNSVEQGRQSEAPSSLHTEPFIHRHSESHTEYNLSQTTNENGTTHLQFAVTQQPHLDATQHTMNERITQHQPGTHSSQEELTTPTQEQQTIRSEPNKTFLGLPELSTLEEGLTTQSQPKVITKTLPLLGTQAQTELSTRQVWSEMSTQEPPNTQTKRSPIPVTVTMPYLITQSQPEPTTKNPTDSITGHSNNSTTELFTDSHSKENGLKLNTPNRIEFSTNTELIRNNSLESTYETKPTSNIPVEPTTNTKSLTQTEFITKSSEVFPTVLEPTTEVTTESTNNTGPILLGETNDDSQTEPVTKSRAGSTSPNEPTFNTTQKTITESRAHPITKSEFIPDQTDTQKQTLATENTQSATQTEPITNWKPKSTTQSTSGHLSNFTNTEPVTMHMVELDTGKEPRTANKMDSFAQSSITIQQGVNTEAGVTNQTEQIPKTSFKASVPDPHVPTSHKGLVQSTQSEAGTLTYHEAITRTGLELPMNVNEETDMQTPEDQAVNVYTPTERTSFTKHANIKEPRMEGSAPTMTAGYHGYNSRTSVWDVGLPSGQPQDHATTVTHYRTESPSSTKSATSPQSITITPQTPGEMMSSPSGRDRIFIVDEQQPVFKVPTISMTYTVNVPQSAMCNELEPCKKRFSKEVTSAYKYTAGFDRADVVNVTLAGSALEYKVQFSVRLGSPMSAEQELVLAYPTSMFETSAPSEHTFLPALHNASLADMVEPCTEWFSCPRGFRCVPQRRLSAFCLSPCHGAFCQNDGICIHRKGQDPVCQCPVGRDFWYMGPACDYRMTHHRLAAIACAVVFCIIICAAAAVFILVRRFQTQILQQKVAQTQSSYRRFSRFDDVPTHFWCPSQTWLTTSASMNSLDNPAFSSSEEVFPLQALGSCVCGCQDGARNNAPTNPAQQPSRAPPRLETSCSSVNDLMVDSGKASDVSVCSWPMEPIHWTPFPILHQLSLQSPFHARRPHSYFEGMELVNTERSWTA